MAIVRSHAAEWKIDPKQVGVLGFSAGGHLSAVLSNYSGERTYQEVDASDRQSVRPNFTILIYPAYLETIMVSATAPATFIVQAEDDRSFIDGTLSYYNSLKLANIPTELHLFSAGGHGYGLRPTDDPVTGWPRLAESWIRHVIQ